MLIDCTRHGLVQLQGGQLYTYRLVPRDAREELRAQSSSLLPWQAQQRPQLVNVGGAFGAVATVSAANALRPQHRANHGQNDALWIHRSRC